MCRRGQVFGGHPATTSRSRRLQPADRPCKSALAPCRQSTIAHPPTGSRRRYCGGSRGDAAPGRAEPNWVSGPNGPTPRRDALLRKRIESPARRSRRHLTPDLTAPLQDWDKPAADSPGRNGSRDGPEPVLSTGIERTLRQPLEDHRRLNPVASTHAFASGRGRRNGVKPVAQRGLRVDCSFQLSEVA